MRYVASPVFTKKLSLVDLTDILGVASFIRFIEDSSNKEEILSGQQNIILLEEDIFLFSKQTIYVYFTFGENDDGEYVLLLDIIIQQTRAGTKEMFTMKNPKTNSSLNPRRNSAINPRRNSVFGGPYLYNNDLSQVGYLVKAKDLVELVFDSMGNFSGILVHANDQVRCHFDKSNDWIGYVVQANEDVALRYNTYGIWIGMII